MVNGLGDGRGVVSGVGLCSVGSWGFELFV